MIIFSTIVILSMFYIVGCALNMVCKTRMNHIGLGFIAMVFSLSLLAIPFSLFNLQMLSYIFIAKVFVFILMLSSFWLFLKYRNFRIEIDLYTWLKENWFIITVVVVSISILFIDYYPTMYSVSNTDDTTYIGGQVMTTFFNEIDPTSGFFNTGTSFVQQVITWKYVWMFFSNLFGMDIVIFNRVILGIVMPIVFYLSISSLFSYFMDKKYVQYLLIPVLFLLIVPIFSDDAWGQIFRVIYTPWFASAYSFIVYPFIVIGGLQWITIKKYPIIQKLVVLLIIFLFGIMMHQVNVFIFLIITIHYFLYKFFSKYIGNKAVLYVIYVLFSINTLLLFITYITKWNQNNEVFQLLEISLLLQDIYTVFFIIIQCSFMYVFITNTKNKDINYLVMSVQIMLFIVLVPQLLQAFISLTGGYEFATRRILDVFILLEYILLGYYVLVMVLERRDSVRKNIRVILILCILSTYYIYTLDDRLSTLLPKVQKSYKYDYLNVYTNPTRIHPLIIEIGKFFEDQGIENETLFGPYYIYSSGVDESLYFTPSLRLINPNMIVVNDIRNGSIDSDMKKKLELLSDYFRCEKSICIEVKIEDMISLFEEVRTYFNLDYVLISDYNSNHILNPLYTYLEHIGQNIYETNKYDFSYNFTIFRLEK